MWFDRKLTDFEGFFFLFLFKGLGRFLPGLFPLLLSLGAGPIRAPATPATARDRGSHDPEQQNPSQRGSPIWPKRTLTTVFGGLR